MLGQGSWPVWLLVILSGLAGQMIKLLVYSVLNRHLMLAVLAQSYGLPSLQATILSCLLVLVVMRRAGPLRPGRLCPGFCGYRDPRHGEAAPGRAGSGRRCSTWWPPLPEAGQFHQRVADYLDPRTHHPVHVWCREWPSGAFSLWRSGPLPG